MFKNNLANRISKKLNSFSFFTPLQILLFFLLSLGFIFFSDRTFAQSFPLGSFPTNIAFPSQIPRTSNNTRSSAANNSPRTLVQSGSEQSVSDSIKSVRGATAVLPIVDSVSLNIRKKLFGFNIFNNPNVSFETSLKIPTPKNYTLGTDDELIIDINGFSEEHYTLPITAEGFIRVPKVGNVFVSGITIEEAKKRIVDRLSKIYVGLKSYNGAAPNTTATVSLGSIKRLGLQF